ncbi:DUF4145 domain-containing protein [Novosphingobium colocasiae]|uniref:DUF4145 domain-containing protein n=1 Tax=Novosphingobium colocasiae TaxID=1256513 RepID=UPI0035B3894D
MDNIRGKYVPPSIDETAFNCPHCGVLAKQAWLKLGAELHKKDETPKRYPAGTADFSTFNDVKGTARDRLLDLANRLESGLPTIEYYESGEYFQFHVFNANISQCFNCNKIAVWIGSALAWPSSSDAPLPNPDLSNEVRFDFEEAGRILHLSPRGAAALLRLAIQKLCKEIGEKGKNIDDDIAALVRKGLDVRVQQALDVVRVIGNQAVHPGQIDLRDDHATAEKLFGLVNLIAEIMITQPKHIAAMFDNLPEGAREAIVRRDKRA